jgi:hypothetical protein
MPSLEEAITTLNESVRELSRHILTIVGQAPQGASVAPAAEEADKPKRGRPRKEDAAAAAAAAGTDDLSSNTPSSTPALTVQSVMGAFAEWLSEFSKDEDKANPAGTHPESKARLETYKKKVKELVGVEKISQLSNSDQDKLKTMMDWLDSKAKKVDRGFGIGRLVADPTPPADSSDGDL